MSTWKEKYEHMTKRFVDVLRWNYSDIKKLKKENALLREEVKTIRNKTIDEAVKICFSSRDVSDSYGLTDELVELKDKDHIPDTGKMVMKKDK